MKKTTPMGVFFPCFPANFLKGRRTGKKKLPWEIFFSCFSANFLIAGKSGKMLEFTRWEKSLSVLQNMFSVSGFSNCIVLSKMYLCCQRKRQLPLRCRHGFLHACLILNPKSWRRGKQKLSWFHKN